jgi:superfamily II DNA or RNA helicase
MVERQSNERARLFPGLTPGYPAREILMNVDAGTNVRSARSRISKRSIDDLILGSKGWAEFYAFVAAIGEETDKGDCFERLMQLYMQSAPHMVSHYKHVWLRIEVPGDVKMVLGLPDTDEGIDIIAETHYGEFHSGQAKFRSNPIQALTMTEIVTFTNLSFVHCKGIAHGLVAHTCGFPINKRELLGNIGELGLDVWEDLNAEDWAAIQARIESREVTFAARRPRPHQQVALTDAITHFLEEGASRGRLIMPCGTGKSLAAFFIAEALDLQTIVVAVPSLALIAQSLKDWTREFLARGEVPDWFVVCSADDVGDISDDDHVGDTYEHGLETDTSVEAIVAWLRRTKDSSRRVVFVTYQSGLKFAEAAREVDLIVDFMILDEAHKTVGLKHKKYAHLIFDENIKASRRLFMTATQRVPQIEDDSVLSMDDVAIYGEQFHLLTCKAAVEQKIICDYEIVIMAVSQADIAELVRRNKLVNTGVDGLDEAQAMRLATGIALKKMYQDRDVRHAISFHGSIFKAEQFREQQDALNAVADPSAVNLHISSKLTTTQRKRLMREFPTYDRALMTNARCLTEGVDIPAIDCVVFADRKNSTVDIVQAAGRAMRISPGKDKGYILIPLVVDDDVDAEGVEAFAKKSGFREVARIVKALSTNDERIVEKFRVIYDGDKIPSGGGIIKFDGSVRLGLNIEFDKFADAIQAKVWERVARGNWRPFDQARAFVRGLGFKSGAEWRAYVKAGKLPFDIPAAPESAFANLGWSGIGDWLGTGAIANQLREFRPFDQARTFVRSFNFKSQSEWNAYTKSGNIPADIPADPRGTYLNSGWVGVGDWLGTNTVATHLRQYRPFKDAREWARRLGLKSTDEWRAYTKSGELPVDIPAQPSNTYADDGWCGMNDWLNYTTEYRGHEYRPFQEAREFVRSQKFKSVVEWRAFAKSAKRPPDIPANPNTVYDAAGWISFGDWLGNGIIAPRLREYRLFGLAREWARSLNLKSSTEWRARARAGTLPPDIPAAPDRIYRNSGWIGFGDWLGTENIAPWLRQYRPFEEARKFARSLGLRSETEWRARTKSEGFPSDIPVGPAAAYADAGWAGWGDWLGTGNVASHLRQFRSFGEARELSRSLGLRSETEWRAYTKSGTLPADIPTHPDRSYRKSGWTGWRDWLGTGLS